MCSVLLRKLTLPTPRQEVESVSHVLKNAEAICYLLLSKIAYTDLLKMRAHEHLEILFEMAQGRSKMVMLDEFLKTRGARNMLLRSTVETHLVNNGVTKVNMFSAGDEVADALVDILRGEEEFNPAKYVDMTVMAVGTVPKKDFSKVQCFKCKEFGHTQKYAGCKLFNKQPKNDSFVSALFQDLDLFGWKFMCENSVMIDSGSSVNILPYEIVGEYKLNLEEDTTTLFAANGTVLSHRGCVVIPVMDGECKTTKVKFMVVEDFPEIIISIGEIFRLYKGAKVSSTGITVNDRVICQVKTVQEQLYVVNKVSKSGIQHEKLMHFQLPITTEYV